MIRSAILLGAAALVMLAQPSPVVFEVASLKPTPPDRGGYTSISPYGTGRLTATNVTLEVLIEMAYGVTDKQIVSAPGWLGSDRFDLSVKAPEGVKLTYEELKAPLQNLLKQRFQLAVHRDKKEVQGYALVVGKRGVKLQAAAKPSPDHFILPDGLRAPGTSVEMLAAMLARAVRRPVSDETGLAGVYDIALQYAPANSTDSPLPSVFTALQEQTGLRLEPRKTQIEALIIDHVERVPTEN